MWDSEYIGGRWDHCERTPGAQVYECVERHCRNGSILDLGCGSGNTGNELKTHCYSRYVGVDISDVAVRKAIERSARNGRAAKNHYLTGDIVSFVPSGNFDVILFRESIYYIPLVKLKWVLNRYRAVLGDEGVLVVDVSSRGTKKGDKIRALIEANFGIVERLDAPESDEFILVFR
jgi:2-polyprenyl-6-hydroxyphenyl methylase/3-demethylubiquinone-9 3-methyltransferase